MLIALAASVPLPANAEPGAEGNAPKPVQDKAGQDKTLQDKTLQDKTLQDKAVQDDKPAPVPPTPQGTSAVVMDLSAIDSVIGKTVKSQGGEDLGHIVDLLVTTSGQVRAAVLDFGGVLGVGTRKIAVDWKALEFANVAKDGVVRLALTRNQVRVAPEYKAGDPVVIIEAPNAAEAPAPASPPQPATPKADTSRPDTSKVSTPQAGATTK